ncbi:MAG: hypothetical protein NZ879_03685 [Archaeoglobaceae archaeon]|nr:hypothetical protein [Archaeoglobaceae archaeon]MDW8118067.1 hypothetical protein [Archaeoglobaceae archaeon]
MISEKVELEKVLPLIRKEIETSEVAKRILELDSKLVEMRKAIEGIVIELTYIKSELKELRDGREKKSVQTQLREEKTLDKLERQVKAEEAKVDVIKREKSELEKKMDKSEEAQKETQKEDDKDLIICD